MGLEQPEERVWDPERYRNYLTLLAHCQFPQQLRSRFDPADAVQETLRKAFESLAQFRGDTAGQFQGWLRVILFNVLREWCRRPGAPAASLERSMEESSYRLEQYLAADQSTPSERVMREEQVLRLAEALARLPDDQRLAVQLHHLGGLSVAEVGERMGRTTRAVAGLLFRGLRALRCALS